MITAIVSWPDSFDFPIFRDRFPQLFQHVDKLIIGFNQHGGNPLRTWCRQFVPGEQVEWIDTEDSGYPGDWRNKSTNTMLKLVNTEWVLSLEPDFLIKDYEDFFYRVKTARRVNDIVMFQEYAGSTERFHPAFMFCKTNLLKNRNLDFSVMGSGMDHFAAVTKKLKNEKYVSLQAIGLNEGEDWFHMRGLTDNYFAPKPYYDLNNFYAYNHVCQKIRPVSKYWIEQMDRCKGKYLNPKIGRFL